MKTRCRSSIYMPVSGIIYTEGKEYDLPEGMVQAYPGYFESLEKVAPAPLNKMVTAEKETVKTKDIKTGPRTKGKK